MPKIALIGAGSAIFARRLLTDIILYPELAQDLQIGLTDVDPERLAVAEKVAHHVLEQAGVHAPVQASVERKPALEGADYVINMIRVGGLASTIVDTEVPKQFGLKQTIADTCGVGGVFRGLRTLPRMLEFAADMEEVCPSALMLNYTNPMPMLSLGMALHTHVRYIGLCHSVQGTSKQLAKRLGVPHEELDYLCAGINHMSWFVRLEHHGQDLYPRLREHIQDADAFMEDPVRYEVFKHVGHFHTESSTHAAEYSAFFMKDDAIVDRLDIKVDKFKTNIEGTQARYEEFVQQLERGEAFELTRSHEYGSQIIHSCETNQPRVVYGSVLNAGLISNLPPDCAVEVPCLVDRNGVQPVRVGELPAACAAMNMTNAIVHQLAVRAIVERKREHVYHACMFDPCTASVLSLDEIHQVVDGILERDARYYEGLFDDA